MAKPVEGSWHGVNSHRYRTKGAEAVYHEGVGWFAVVGTRGRGPLSSLDAAMKAADDMLAAQGVAA